MIFPAGDQAEVTAKYDGGITHNGHFTYGPSIDNAARAHQLKTGQYGATRPQAATDERRVIGQYLLQCESEVLVPVAGQRNPANREAGCLVLGDLGARCDDGRLLQPYIGTGLLLLAQRPFTLTGDSGTYTAPAQQNLYGFDPLNIAQYATQFLGPYLQASGEATQKAIANYAPEMQQALKGANPIVQAAFSSTIPLMQQAETLDNQAVTNATANAPYLNQIISGLTNAQTAAKAAQTAYAEAPYVAQAVQGTTTNGLSYSQMLAQALAGLQPGTATSSPILGTSTSDTAGAGTAATAAQQAAQNAYQQQAAQQLITSSLGN